MAKENISNFNLSSASLSTALSTLGEGSFTKFQELLRRFFLKEGDDITEHLIFLKDAAVLFGAKSATLLPIIEKALDNGTLPIADSLIFTKPPNTLQAFCSLPVDSLTLPEEIFSLYVGDLNPNVSEQDLMSAFSSNGDLKGAIVIRDKMTHQCKGYGFLQFRDKETRDIVLSSSGQIIVQGRPVRLKPSEEKLSVFVGNLDATQTPADLVCAIHHILDQVIPAEGTSVEVKAGVDGRARGYAFVTCRSQPYAELVRQILGASSVSGRALVAKWSDSQKPIGMEGKQDMDIYVANFPVTITEEDLRNHFTSCGEIYKCVITRDPTTNQSRGFGFVGFTTAEAKNLAISTMNDTELGRVRVRVSNARSNFSDYSTQRQRPSIGAPRNQHGSPYQQGMNNYGQTGYVDPSYGQAIYGQANYGQGYHQGYTQQAYAQPYGGSVITQNTATATPALAPVPTSAAATNSYQQYTAPTSYQAYQTPSANPTHPYAGY